jgi:hypothetical protein
MATQYTRRLIIVCNAAVAALANNAANQADTADGGEGSRTFRVGLSATGDAPATHYWCSWSMRPSMATAIRSRLRERGATAAEVAPVADKGTPSSTRFAVFDVADGWTPDAVLTACGLQRVVVAD